jgi:hypothetical protein
MTPFQQLRVWARRASVGERVGTAIAAVIALSLVVWALVPSSQHSTEAALTGGSPAAGESPSTTAPPANGEPAAVSPATSSPSSAVSGGAPARVASTGAAATSSGGPAGCVSPPGTDQGVTSGEIKIAVTLTNIVGSTTNSAFGIPSAEEQQSFFQAVIDNANAAGGAACRKIVPDYITINPADPSGQHAGCLEIEAAKAFAVLDVGAFFQPPDAKDCVAQLHVPLVLAGFLTQRESDAYYPYLLSSRGMYDVEYRNTVFALKSLGFFDGGSGFKKLGILRRDCAPEVFTKFVGWLHQAGLTDGQIDSYNVGCPNPFASPADIQQAILQFQRNGVTHVTYLMANLDFANFTKISQQQGFHPKYGLADDGTMTVENASGSPDSANTDGAIGITPMRVAEQNSGVPPSAGTARCNAIQVAAGKPPVYQQSKLDFWGGFSCNLVWMLVAGASKAPQLTRAALADGLHAAKSVDFSFPDGPNDFGAPRTIAGGQFWRPARFAASCGCWKLLDANFHPSF